MPRKTQVPEKTVQIMIHNSCSLLNLRLSKAAIQDQKFDGRTLRIGILTATNTSEAKPKITPIFFDVWIEADGGIIQNDPQSKRRRRVLGVHLFPNQ